MRTKKFFDPDAAIKARTVQQGDCTVYPTSHDHKGYAYIKIAGVLRKVHRYVWERDRGAIPDRMQIDHTCWNKACYNLDHLRLVTNQQNQMSANGARRNNLSTGIRNVSRRKNGRYAVALRKGGVDHYFGQFDTLDEASEVADRERARLFGRYAGRGGPNGYTATHRQSAAGSAAPVEVH
ncbi:MAG: HNH endonuclease [Brevibacterium sp.]|nr:HNH endonuclease [Brevibacterium sp.]